MPPSMLVRDLSAMEFSHSPQPINDRFGWLREKLIRGGA